EVNLRDALDHARALVDRGTKDGALARVLSIGQDLDRVEQHADRLRGEYGDNPDAVAGVETLLNELAEARRQLGRLDAALHAGGAETHPAVNRKMSALRDALAKAAQP